MNRNYVDIIAGRDASKAQIVSFGDITESNKAIGMGTQESARPNQGVRLVVDGLAAKLRLANALLADAAGHWEDSYQPNSRWVGAGQME